MYPGAHAAIDDWVKFPWHQHASSPRSSQMLAIDVFGTIKSCPAHIRDAIMAKVASQAGIAAEGPWQISMEWQDGGNVLREYTPTQVDAVAISERAMLLFECKFTEAGGGCSQIIQDRHGRIACDGSYRLQQNPQNGVTAHCALSGKGIAYWEWIEKLYGIDRASDHTPCPFAFDAYQWMRNSALALAISKRDHIQTRVLAVYTDAGHLQTAAKVRKGRLGTAPLSPHDEILPLSYQTLLSIAADTDPEGNWSALSEWVDAKIEATKPAPSAQMPRTD